MNILNLIGRNKELFRKDISDNYRELLNLIANSSFLVLGAAGSIGQALTKELFLRNPKKLHVVDISENNLVELVRDIRSSKEYTYKKLHLSQNATRIFPIQVIAIKFLYYFGEFINNIFLKNLVLLL